MDSGPTDTSPRLNEVVIALKGGGDLATGIALRLFSAGFQKLFIMEASAPTVIRRTVAFASALYEETITVEGVTAVGTDHPDKIPSVWDQGCIPVLADPAWNAMAAACPHVLVDAVVAKKNLGTQICDAPLVVGLGPGFSAGKDVHIVIETQRGHDLGRLITKGEALANTSTPEAVMGITLDRVVRSPGTGKFISHVSIGDMVTLGQILGYTGKLPVTTKINGVVRGLIHDRLHVKQGQKIGDVDPRADARFCRSVSDKARALGGAVLEAVLGRFNR